jgi:two-component system, cell cycle sensor histidine kinase and response regulator CckA
MSERGLSILVVDDEPVDLAVFRQCLETAGFVVFAATGYNDGLETFLDHADEIELLVTDISLPVKNGLELAKACLERKPGLKVLAVSGWVGAEILQFYNIPVGDRHFLPKPFRASEFISRVNEVIASLETVSWLSGERDSEGDGLAAEQA